MKNNKFALCFKNRINLSKLLFLFLLCTADDILGQNNIAEVNKIQGFYIFTDNQPTGEYEVIGEVNTDGHTDKDIVNSGAQYQAVRDFLIKKARQVNYSADGLIFSLVNGGTDKAIIIKFKEKESNKSKAKVNKIEGLYIFTDCEPVSENKYLGTSKIKFSFGSFQYDALKSKMIKKIKHDYPDAQGIIIKFVFGAPDNGDAIVFEK